MRDALYAVPAPVIAVALLVCLAAALEAGYRIGMRSRVVIDEAWRARVGSIEAAMLGLLALVLGFTFSLALQRFDHRTLAVVDEANAIGTAYLRSHFLVPALRGDTQQLLEAYARQRACDQITTDELERRGALLSETVNTQRALWRCARAAVDADPNEVRTGLYVEALNAMFDSFASHNAQLENHVPAVVIWLLFATLLISVVIVGYACGLSGHRAGLVTNGLLVLIVLVVHLIIDLDRPRRGLITVDWSSLIDNYAAIVADRRAATTPETPRIAAVGICHDDAVRLAAAPACNPAAAGARTAKQEGGAQSATN
jgi:hypothetical protein